jgi:large subunit ribosomal protein L15
MQVHQLNIKRKRAAKKRIGRGGKRGTYSGRGMKGQKSRSGFSQRATFEGGKAGIVAVTKKKKGFKSKRPKAQVVNLQELEKKFQAGAEITKQALKQVGLIRKINLPVKILAKGKVSKNFSVVGIMTSSKAKEAIEKSGGTIELPTKKVPERKKQKKDSQK